MKAVLKFSLLAFFIFVLSSSGVYGQKNSSGEDTPRLSLITCDPGGELYSAFGHSALRVFYPESGRDIVFNFGLFDFNTPNFYSKFIRGSLKYMLGIQYTEDFIWQYEREGRGVYEQHLNLTATQRDEILSRLSYLYLPQNRYYLYSFLYKNCTTELRDLIFDVVNGSKEGYERVISDRTFRQEINDYVRGWPRFGINLILGSTLDRPVDGFEKMFLPDNLYDGVAELCSEDGVRIVNAESVLVQPDGIAGKKGVPFIDVLLSPFFVFSLLLVLVLISLIGRRRLFLVFSGVYITICALTGFVLLGIIMITEHTELYSNYNLLWANPFFLTVVISGIAGLKKTERLLSAISLIFLALLQLVWAKGAQEFNPVFFIIVLTLALSFAVRIIRVGR
jgi:hypothetical protein